VPARHLPAIARDLPAIAVCAGNCSCPATVALAGGCRHISSMLSSGVGRRVPAFGLFRGLVSS